MEAVRFAEKVKKQVPSKPPDFLHEIADMLMAQSDPIILDTFVKSKIWSVHRVPAREHRDGLQTGGRQGPRRRRSDVRLYQQFASTFSTHLRWIIDVADPGPESEANT
jgi:hypothetical protein